MPRTIKHVFTYGTLMFPPVWNRVVTGDYESGEATIHGFRRLQVRGKEHPGLVISRGAPTLIGRIYFNVSRFDIERLDHFETQRYARVTVAATLSDETAETVLAEAYLALNLSELTDQNWDVQRFEREGLPKFMDSYVSVHAPK
jgi:gamma-glutamylcyclotransferase (GGCT)/AIG2-like uncharacterized protein YtfP